MSADLVALSDLVDLQVGFAFKSADFTLDESGTRLLRGDNVAQGVVRWANAARWNGKAEDRYELQEGDVVLAMDRPWIGAGLRFASLTASDVPSYLVQRVARLRARDGVHQRYLHYVIAGHNFTRHVLSTQTGTAVPHISASQILSFRTVRHSSSEQQAIAEVLGALDDKIGANATVIAKADELSAATYRAAATGSAPLSSLARFVNGKAFTKDATGTGRVVVRIAELNSGLGGSTVFNDIEVAEDHLARPGDLLFAWSGSLMAARWFRPEAIINQHIFKVVPDKGSPMWLVNQAVRAALAEFRSIAADKATTMGHIQRHHLDRSVPVPSSEVAVHIGPFMTGLWETALAAETESERLAVTRDELLPLLMSGHIRVRDAERALVGMA